MADLKKSQRYQAILDLVAAQPAGCTVRQLADLLQQRFADQDWSDSTVRRDVDELLLVGWIERVGRNHVIGLELGRYLLRRFEVLACRAAEPLDEVRTLFRSLNSTLNPNHED